jgi:hypothetical protein
MTPWGMKFSATKVTGSRLISEGVGNTFSQITGGQKCLRCKTVTVFTKPVQSFLGEESKDPAGAGGSVGAEGRK